MILGLEGNALEAAGLHLRKFIKIGEPGIGHGPVGIDKAVDGHVLRKHLTEVLDGLGTHARLKPRVVVRVEPLVRREHAEAVQLQPLPRKIVDEAANFTVHQHPVHFLPQAFVVELAALGRDDETGVGHRTPEEIREPGGEFRVSDTFTGLRLPLDEVDEMSGGHHAVHGDTVGVDGLFTRLALGTVGLKIFHQLIILHPTAPSAFGETLQMLRDHLGRRVIWRYQSGAPRLFLLRHQRPFPFDPIEQHCGEKAVALVIEHLRCGGVQEQGLATMREHIALAGQCIAEGRALSPVDHIRRYYAKI